MQQTEPIPWALVQQMADRFAPFGDVTTIRRGSENVLLKLNLTLTKEDCEKLCNLLTKT